MSDPWWPDGYDLPAFRVKRETYGINSGGDYVRGSSVTTLPQTALRYPTRALDPSALGAATKGILFAHAFDYNTVEIEWAWPTSIEETFQEVAVVRSTFGAPADPSQGQVVFRSLRSGLPTMVVGEETKLSPPPIIYDQPLPSGHWYYYTAFFRVGPYDWTPLMVDQTLLPKNYHHSDHLWYTLPPWYQYTDDNYSFGNGFLRRFLTIFGFEQDRVREYVESLLRLHWIDRSPMPLLKHLGANYGYPYEAGIGDIRYRALLANLSQLLLKRGTTAGLLGVVETVSKYDCDITQGPNNTLLPDDSNFVTDLGHWAPIHPDVNLTAPAEANFLAWDKVKLTLNPTSVLPPAGAPGSAGTVLVDTAVADTNDIFIVAGAGKRTNADATVQEFVPYYTGIPTDPGEVYGFSMWIKMQTPSACSLYMIPFTDTGKIGDKSAAGAQVSTTPVTPTANTWTQLSMVGQMPADGHYLVPGLYIDNRSMTGASGGRSPRVDIAAVMVYRIESETPVSVQAPDRYLTMGDPAEKIGATTTTPTPYEGFTLGAPTDAATSGGTLADVTHRVFFTTHFTNALFANQNIMENSNIRLCFFRSAPSLDTIDAAWLAARTKAELLATFGWTEVTGIGGYPLTNTLNVATRAVPIPNTSPVRNNRYVIFSQYPFSQLAEAAPVEAIGIEYIGTLNGVVNPLIMVTTTPLGDGTNLFPADALTANPDVGNLGAASNRWMFGWAEPTPLSYDMDAGEYFSTPDIAALDITGDLTIVAKIAADDWTPSAAQQIVGKWDASGQFAYRLVLNTNGTLQLDYTVNGTTVASRTSTVATGVADGATKWVAVTIDVTISTNNETRFWTSDDGSSWTQLGTTVTVGGTAGPFFNSTSTLRVGAASGGLLGKVYKASVYNGIGAGGIVGGTLVADFVAAASYPYTDSTGKVWTAVGVLPGDAVGPTTIPPVEGPLSIYKGAPTFEASNTVHLWLYPSRANMIANPSFEAIGTNFWASNGTITRVTDPSLGGGAFSGNFFVGAGPPCIVESNVWSTRMGDTGSEYWTLQLMAKGGPGKLKLGLISWDADYRATASDWGDETWDIMTDAWIHVAAIRRAPDADTAMLRVETDFKNLTIDCVIAERGTVKDWPYFDGDSTFALQDSYTWYGGSSRRGASYSMWYDMRRAVMGRLFATPVSDTYPGNVLSDQEVAEAGMVYQWVPAGVSVVPHIDVFYPGDTRPPPPAKSAAIQPYYDPDTQRMGVINPWV